MSEELIIEIRLIPDYLSGYACEAFVNSLAHAVRSSHPDGALNTSHSTWSQRADDLLRAGALPLPADFQLLVHLEQLSEVLARSDCHIHLTTGSLPRHQARAVEWLESHSKVPVTVRVASPVNVHPDTLAIQEITLPPMTAAQGCSVSMFTLAGQPHWASPGEQKLHRRLESDEEFKGMFDCNAKVVSVHGRVYWADFLHRTIKLVVEVDGYRYHGNRQAFFSDRHRDYELRISGYHTLRIDHDEIIRDIESVVGKIRDVCDHLETIQS